MPLNSQNPGTFRALRGKLQARACIRAKLHGLLVYLARNGLIDTQRLFIYLARNDLIDAQQLFFESNGILQYQNTSVSGERFVLEHIVPQYLREQVPQICDVGANVGDYIAEILQCFPNAQIFAFEPHPRSYSSMAERFATRTDRIHLHNLAVGSEAGELTLYDYQVNEGSGHATFYADIITKIHKGNLARNSVQVVRLDDFFDAHGIQYVDLLKIDTEGHELDVLKGASRFINEQRISIIQFEFNEMNVFSRVFLRDFYQILQNFEFYRLARDHLIALDAYQARNEIFQYQNILAISAKVKRQLALRRDDSL